MLVNKQHRDALPSIPGLPAIDIPAKQPPSISWYRIFKETVSSFLQSTNNRDWNYSTRSLHNAIVEHHSTLPSTKASQFFLALYLHKNATVREKTCRQINRPMPAFETNISNDAEYHREYDSQFIKLSVAKINQDTIDKSPIEFPSQEYFYPIREGLLEALSYCSKVFEPKNFSELEQIVEVTKKQDCTKVRLIIILLNNLINTTLPKCQQIREFAELKRYLKALLSLKLADSQIWNEKTNLSNICPLFIHQHGGCSAINILQPLTQSRILNIITRFGYTPTIFQFVQMLQNLNINPFLTPLENDYRPKLPRIAEINYGKLNSFFAIPIIQWFKTLADTFTSDLKDNRTPIIQSILASANYKMLSSLKTPLKSILHNPEHPEYKIANSSLNRIEAILHLSKQYRNNDAKYCLLHELLAEEILLLLNLTHPYLKEGPNSFSHIVTQNFYLWRKRVKELPSLQITPKAYPFASGMACVDAILKAHFQLTPQPKIALSSLFYYEIKDLIKSLPHYFYDVIDPNNHTASLRNFDKLGFAPNLLLFDIRTVPGLDPFENGQKTLLSIIDSLLDQNYPYRPLTAAIDVTNDKLLSKEIHRIICHYEKAIQEKRLNIILYRSSHKFDQLGVDKFNGGYIEVYTADNTLIATFEKIQGKLDGLDYQALCHFHRNAPLEIHEYLKLHYKNAEKIYNGIAATYEKGKQAKLVPRKDTKAYCLEIKIDLMASFSHEVRILARERGIALYERDSFGFNETVMCCISDTNLRIAPGTHNSVDIEQITSYLLQTFEKVESEP